MKSSGLPPDLCETHSVGPDTREWMLSPHMAPGLNACGIFLTGWSEARPGFTFIRPRFPMSQVLVCTGGHGQVWVDGKWMDCGEGMAYVTPCHIFHAYRALPDSIWTVYWVTYHISIVEAKEPLLLPTDPKPLVSAIRHLYDEATGIADRQTLMHWSQLVHTGAQRIVRPVSYDPRLRRLWRTVQEKPQHPWDVTQLAAEVGISDEHLRRLCQKEVGCSPMDYVTQLRMQHAVALLATGAYPMTVIAERVGYSSPFAFSAAFKRVLGIPPSQYIASKLSPSHDAL